MINYYIEREANSSNIKNFGLERYGSRLRIKAWVSRNLESKTEIY